MKWIKFIRETREEYIPLSGITSISHRLHDDTVVIHLKDKKIFIGKIYNGYDTKIALGYFLESNATCRTLILYDVDTV